MGRLVLVIYERRVEATDGLGGDGERGTGFGRPAGDLGDSVEAGGAPGFDLGFAAFAAEAGLLLGWGFVAPGGGGRALRRIHWGMWEGVLAVVERERVEEICYPRLIARAGVASLEKKLGPGVPDRRKVLDLLGQSGSLDLIKLNVVMLAKS